MKGSNERVKTRAKMSHVVPSVLSSATWCATLIAMGCANATYEPLGKQPSRREQPDELAAAGQPNDLAPAGQTDEPAPAAAAPTWCAARAVLESKCQRCHGAEPEHGAPFSLVSYDDTQVTNRKGKPRYESIAAALESEAMPPRYLDLEPKVEELSAEERAVLSDWCAAGAPGAADDDCHTDD